MTNCVLTLDQELEAADEFARCAELSDLVCIFDPTVQVVEFPRDVDPVIATYLEQCIAGSGFGMGLRHNLSPFAPLNPDCFPDLPGRTAFVHDIYQLALLYIDLMGCDAAGARLEVIEKAMCPRFHVDRVGIRMLCSYRGPGTEILDSQHANRSCLGSGANGLPDESSGLLREAGKIQCLAPFSVVLLKGSLWQGNVGRGVIHRSPAIGAGEAPRILLAVDAIWD